MFKRLLLVLGLLFVIGLGGCGASDYVDAVPEVDVSNNSDDESLIDIKPQFGISDSSTVDKETLSGQLQNDIDIYNSATAAIDIDKCSKITNESAKNRCINVVEDLKRQVNDNVTSDEEL